MKQFFSIFLMILLLPVFSFGQSIFNNPIEGVKPNNSDPYTIGQVVDSNITVSGISMGTGINGINANDRYDARSWNSAAIDPNAYFEFSLTPNVGKEIDFVSFAYTGQVSPNGPTNFAFRSSIDGFVSDIGLVSAEGTTVSLSSDAYQNRTATTTFRIYGWGASAGTGTFSINDFIFNGIVGCAIPETPVLSEIAMSCGSTSFSANWMASLNATGYSVDVATDTNFLDFVSGFNNKPLGNVASHNVTGLVAEGTYYVRLRATNDCGNSVNSNTIIVSSPVTTYNGTWSNGIPDATKKVRFSSDFNISTTLEACYCQIDSGVEVSVASGVVLKLENGLDVLGTGTLTFENNASLVQINDFAVNTGSIIYKRITTPIRSTDYTYWSSPVSPQTLYDVSPLTKSGKFYSRDAVGNKWVQVSSATIMRLGVGYIIRGPETYSVMLAAPYIASFVGKPNNGSITLTPTVELGRNYLIGNPYPSAIDGVKFLQDNSFLGTLYFWTHITAFANNKYTSDDYAIFNLSGGTGASTDVMDKAPSGTIASGQAFFASAVGPFAGNVFFNNSMRMLGGFGIDNSEFFRMSTSTKTSSIKGVEKHRIWLNLTNSEGAFKQTLVAYITGATNEYDYQYDGRTYNANKYIDFYSINDSKNFVIQGRALPFNKIDTIPLGYKSTVEGTFSINLDHVDGLFVHQKVFVEDKSTGVIFNLKKGPYSFTTLKGTFDDRFVLRYTANTKEEQELESFNETKYKISFSILDNQLKIRSVDEKIGSVTIYDLTDNQLYSKNNINCNQFLIPDLISKQQILIVKTVLSNGVRLTNKVVF